MIHVTVCTPQGMLDHPHLSALVSSAGRLGLRTAVLTHEAIPTGYYHIYKLFLVRRFLRDLPRDEIVLHTDATDVCFVNDASEASFVAAFERAGTDVLFSAEGNLYPDKLAPRVPTLPGPYAYLNAGCYLGRAGALLEILDAILTFWRRPLGRMCDQDCLWRYLIANPGGIPLDHEARIFQSAFFPEDLVATPDRLGNRHNDATPLTLHFNGHKELLDALFTSDEEPARSLREHVAARGYVTTPGLVASLPSVAPSDARRGLPRGSFSYRVPYRPLGTRVVSALVGFPFQRPPSLDRDLADLTLLAWGKSMERIRNALLRRLGPRFPVVRRLVG